uniref:Centrosomal protein 20 n=1 Tax=Tetradesmus obliquus TaxID=3088 RepID=A0A383WB26_TETOB|eukprot:jgi/Sobl393_1/78/SZX74817.1
MASIGELKDAIKDTLDRKGLLKQLQGHMRAQVYKILLDAEEDARPEPCNENLIINELIREYLIFNGYRDTLSVFLPESGQPQTRPFDREFLAQHLNINETQSTEQVPLLYAMAAQHRQLGAHKIKQPATSHAVLEQQQQQQQQQQQPEDLLPARYLE